MHYDLTVLKEKIQVIRLTDSNGKIVINKQVSSIETEMYTVNLPEGICFVDFIGQEKSFHERIMISY